MVAASSLTTRVRAIHLIRASTTCEHVQSLTVYLFLCRPHALTALAFPAAEVEILKLKDRLRDAEEQLADHRRSSESASDIANSSQSRLAAAEEEVAKLRLEVKTQRSALATAQAQAEELKGIVSRALADVETAEAAQAEAEASLTAARSAEAAAQRVLSSYEDQIRDLRAQLASLQASSGSREDELRRDLDDMTAKWLRAQAAAEENGLMALAQAFGLNINSNSGISTTATAAAVGYPSSGASVLGGGGAADDSGTVAAAQRIAASIGAALQPGASGAGASGAASSSSTATSITEALIGQLASLQAELQSKRDAWAAQRAALQARVAAAEAAAEAADADVRRAEAAAAEASSAAAALRTELISLRGAKARSDAEATLLGDRLRDAEARLLSLSAAHDAAQKQISEMGPTISDLRLRVEEHAGARAAGGHMVAVLKDQLSAAQEECVGYKREVAGLQRELAALQQRTNANGSSNTSRLDGPSAYHSPSTSSGSRVPLTPSGSAGAVGAEGDSWLHSALGRSSSTDATAAVMGGPTSAVQATIQALERERDIMTEQVVALTSRLAGMEGELIGGSGYQSILRAGDRSIFSLLVRFILLTNHHKLPPLAMPPIAALESSLASTRAQLASLTSEHGLLLELLGERDEELEELRGELEEVKETFRIQLEALMKDAVAAEGEGVSAAAGSSLTAAPR